MQAEKTGNSASGRSKSGTVRLNSLLKPRIIKWVLVILACLVLLVFFVVPAYVSSESAREMILSKINRQVRGRCDFAELSMGWFKGVELADFSYVDQSGNTSVFIKRILTRPRYGSIILGNLAFGKTIVDEPAVKVNVPDVSSSRQVAKRVRGGAGGEKAKAFGLPVERIDLVVNNGNVQINSSFAVPATEKEVDSASGPALRRGRLELAEINGLLNLRPPGKQTNFAVDLKVVDTGDASQIKAEGRVRPAKKRGWSLTGTSGDFVIEVDSLELASLGPFFAAAKLDVQAEGKFSTKTKLTLVDGRLTKIDAQMSGAGVRIKAPQLKGDRFVTDKLDVAVKIESKDELVEIDNIDIKTDWLDVEAEGVVPKTARTFEDFVETDSIRSLITAQVDCDLAALSSIMPRTLGLKESVRIMSGRLAGSIETYVEQGRPPTTAIGGKSLWGRREIIANATVMDLKGSVDGKAVALSAPVVVDVKITSDEAETELDNLDISASFFEIHCAGPMEALNYSAEVDLAALQADLGRFIEIGEYRMEGTLAGSGKVNVSTKAIAASGSSTVTRLRVTGAEGVTATEPSARIEHRVVADLQEGVLNIETLQMSGGFGRLYIKDGVLPLGEGAKKALSLAVSGRVDLAKVRPFAVLFASFPQEMGLFGKLSVPQLNIRAEGQVVRVAAQQASVKDLKVTYPQRLPFEQSEAVVSFDVDFNPAEKTYTVKSLKLVSPQIKVHKAQVTSTRDVEKMRLAGSANVEYELEAVSTLAGAFLPKGLKVKGERKHEITFASEYPADEPEKLLANLSTKAKFGFDEAQYMGLVFGPVQTDIQFENGVLTISPFSGTVNNGEFNFAASANFKQEPRLLRIAEPVVIKGARIDDNTAHQLWMYVNPIFAEAVGVTGVANFYCERLAIPLAGAGRNDLEIVGTIGIDNLQLRPSGLLGQIITLMGVSSRGVDMKIHPTEFVLRNGFLAYEDMQLDVGDYPVNFKGVIGLDKTLDMEVTLPFTLGGRTARVGAETSGERITLPLKGTVDKPQLDMGKLLEEQLKREALRGLEKLLR